MINYLKSLVRSRIASNSGAGIIILLLTIIPLIILVPLVAIDVNLYLLTRAQLQNSLDSSASIALNVSTDDAYRADKVLKIITKKDSSNNFIKGLQQGVANNFRPLNSYIHISPNGADMAALGAPKEHVLTFTPGFNFTPNPAQINVTYDFSTGQSAEYIDGTTLTSAHALDGSVSMVLTSDVVLPSLSKLANLFGGSHNFKATATVRSGVTGIRVLRSDDFDQSDDAWFN